MKTINIYVIDKCPVVESMTGSAISDNTYQFKFKFDSEWQDGAKTFLLVNPWGNYNSYLMENDEITVEIPYDGRLSVGVMQGKTATSRPCMIDFKPSIKKLMGEEIPPPSDDVYAQIMDIINDLEQYKLNPVEKTDDMTQPVGRDENGQLFTAPSSGGGGSGLPTITEADEGRVLTASGGAAVWRDLPKYTGEYSVTPEVDTEQTLDTAGTYLTDNVTIKAIPDYEVSNEAGGNTFIIGKELI